jgi:hypothetical protein
MTDSTRTHKSRKHVVVRQLRPDINEDLYAVEIANDVSYVRRADLERLREEIEVALNGR